MRMFRCFRRACAIMNRATSHAEYIAMPVKKPIPVCGKLFSSFMHVARVMKRSQNIEPKTNKMVSFPLLVDDSAFVS